MAQENIHPSTSMQTRWAVKQEFLSLPLVDPAFSPKRMGVIRRFLLKYFVLPSTYHQRSNGFIIHVDEKPAGYIFLRYKDLSVRIETIGVKEELRRKGYAAELISYADKFAGDAELKFLAANLTRENNSAIAFFEIQGFVSTRQYGWETEINLDHAPKENSTIETIALADVVDIHDDWVGRELAQGAPGLKEVLEVDYPPFASRPMSLHAICLDQDQPLGYLRLSRQDGFVTAFLASDPSTWKSSIQLDWLTRAYKKFAPDAKGLKINMASDKHYAASREVFSNANFKKFSRPRFLMLKQL
ncbi:MAG: GNAT family N-acetyltransferase [Chloroflexota bacterium]